MTPTAPAPPPAFSCVYSLIAAALLLTGSALTAAETVALWLFDEPVGLYPSTPLEASAGIDAPLVLGLGGSVVPGRFGQALSTTPFPSVTIPSEGEHTAALHRFPVPQIGRAHV